MLGKSDDILIFLYVLAACLTCILCSCLCRCLRGEAEETKWQIEDRDRETRKAQKEEKKKQEEQEAKEPIFTKGVMEEINRSYNNNSQNSKE